MRPSVNYGSPDHISDIEVIEMARKSLGLDSLLSKDQLNEPDFEGDEGLLIDSDGILLKNSVRSSGAISEIKSDTLEYRRALKVIGKYHFKYPGIARKLYGTGGIKTVFSTQEWLAGVKQRG
jgi:hypothetical protein